MTRDAYGPVMVRSCWAKGYHEPLYLVSNMDAAEAACRYYHKLFRIETFFSDQKAGVAISTSRLSQTPSVFLGYELGCCILASTE